MLLKFLSFTSAVYLGTIFTCSLSSMISTSRVTYTDKYAQEKSTIFAGRVIYLHGFGTNHKVLLRNFVNGTMVNLKVKKSKQLAWTNI